MYHLGQEAFPVSNTEWAPCVRLTAQMTSRVGKQIHCFKPISIKKVIDFYQLVQLLLTNITAKGNAS